MSLDMDMDLQDRRADAAALDMDIDLRDRRAGPAGPDAGSGGLDRLGRPDDAVPVDPGFDPQERSGGAVSLDRLVDVINDVLAVPPSEGLALLVQTQLARAAAPERQDADAATLPEVVGA